MKLYLKLAIFVFGITFAAASNAATLVIGAISEHVREEISRYQPLMELLKEELESEGITAVELEILPTFQSMSSALKSGSVHVFVDSPLVVTMVARDSGAKAVLKRWKDGVGSYHSIIVASVKSKIETLDDLVGRCIAFEERESSSGFMLPAGLIRAANLPMVELASREAVPPKDTVGYIFSGHDNNTLSWLFRGWIDAAGTDPESFEKLQKAAPGRFRIIARSIELPRNIMVLSSHVSSSLEAKLTDALIGLHETPAGKAALKTFNNTTRFEKLDDDISETLNEIELVLDRLRSDKML